MKRIIVIVALILASRGVKAQQTESGGMILSKGSGYVGLLLSYSNTEKENTSTAFENIIKSSDQKTSVRLGGGYFIRNNMAAGVGLSLGKNKLDKETKNPFGPNTITENNINAFGISAFIRNYLSLDEGRHFYLVSQTGLLFGYDKGTEKSLTGSDESELDYSKVSGGISFSPGIVVFIRNGFAFELNIPVGGINFSKEVRSAEGEEDQITTQSTIDFNINILNLNLGFSYYFKGKN